MLEDPKNGRHVLAFLVLMVASLVGLLLLPPIRAGVRAAALRYLEKRVIEL